MFIQHDVTMIKGESGRAYQSSFFGFLGLAVFYLFAFFKPDNMVVDKYYWWFVVHLWVEGISSLYGHAALLPHKATDDRSCRSGYLIVVLPSSQA